MTLIKYCFFASILTLSLNCWSIVVRHDVQPSEYEIEKAPPFFADMPNGGHGALIAPNWVVTVAHLVSADITGQLIKIGMHQVEVEKVIIHPGVTEIPEDILAGDASNLMEFMMSAHDIALVKLNTRLPYNAPIEIYSKNNELGKIITGYGRGTTGNGNTGSVSGTQGVLRQLQNRIEETHPNWLSITFDYGENALELEGIDGSWDSGGPLIFNVNRTSYLVGLFCWDYIEGNLEEFAAAHYGMKSYQVRLSNYSEWIKKTIATN
ncbi:trypsin-like serine protease [Alteromonas stellipolaris]|uniref:trypsin-like serine protease n=1 Tax=Alteromonas stellipolaris TaxID=233316 RepID=UPI002119B141|nr:trypsin-like serine protease [Alteromonas stellipolaris]MCQ8849229.1 trypsin-like serine protease [Alteromonas stellipolaris]